MTRTRLRFILDQRGMSQTELASASDVSAHAINGLCTGRIRRTTPTNLARLAEVLDADPQTLLDTVELPTRPTTRLRSLRLQRGISGAKLSRLACTNAGLVSSTENGRTVPSAQVLQSLATALEYDGAPASLLDEVDAV